MGDPLADLSARMVQYGNTHDIPRETPLKEAIVEGMKWAITDFIETMERLGIPPCTVLSRLHTYYVPAVEVGGGHYDPLAQAIRPDDAVVHPVQIFGWKVAVFVFGPEPGEPLVEGGRPRR